MEKWRLYTEKLEKTNIYVSKGESIPEGFYHMAVEIWIINSDGDLLLVKRSKMKKFHPNEWECIGGSAINDETFLEAAIREICEEIGIKISSDELEECGYEVRTKHIVMTYFLYKNMQLEDIRISKNEIESVKWYNVYEFEQLIKSKAFVKFLIRRYQKYIKDRVYEIILTKKPLSIQNLATRKKELISPKRGLPDTGARFDGSDFMEPLKSIEDAFEIYSRELPKIEVDHEDYDNNVGGGSPMQTKPFPGVKEAVDKLLDSTVLSQYPMAAGDSKIRQKVLGYLVDEGFSDCLTDNNIIFTSSTTQAFSLLCNLILRPYDVILFEAPTYGLYTFIPERYGGITRFIPLTYTQCWIIDSEELAKLIDAINDELKDTYASKLAYCPKVVAVYQSNPNNPIGRVISYENREQLKNILKICHDRSVLYIDDLLYMDLSFDKKPYPAMSISGYESDVITFLGVSKSFGLAGIRSGMIVADDVIIRGIRNLLFQHMDSPSHLQAVILGEIFNNSIERKQKYTEYFKPILQEYKIRYFLLKAGICGIETISEDRREVIQCEVFQEIYQVEEQKNWLQGIEGISIINGTEPEAGFFALLDFTNLKGKHYQGTTIKTEEDALYYLYKTMKIKYITGKSIAWPDQSQWVARVNYAIERKEIIFFVQCLKNAILQLEHE